jgi:Ser/Thr protein kinase RdoA (MazF antagonist)
MNTDSNSRVLAAFGIDAAALLGAGGEASVYALDVRHVLRIHHAGTSQALAAGRSALLVELAQSAARVPFALPRVVETRVVAQRLVTVEARLPGHPLNVVLGEARGAERVGLIRAYLDAAARIADLAVRRPWYGELLAEGAIRATTFRAYLQQRAARSLAAAGTEFAHVDAAQLAQALPEPAEASLVHLDAFPGNMLSDGRTITAVLDFSQMAMVGDRRLDPLTAVAYLDAAITPEATDADRAVAQTWLAERRLGALYQPARRWVAAYWSFAQDDQRLWQWCRAILLG